jgi:hypothetical protein
VERVQFQCRSRDHEQGSHLPLKPPSWQPPANAVYIRTSGRAIGALVTAVAGGLGIICYCLPPLPCGIVAIYIARKARREIRESGGLVQGTGLASAAEIIGWLDVVFGGLLGGLFIWLVAVGGFPGAP